MLDIRTVLILNIFYNILLGFVMVFYGSREKASKGVTTIGYGIGISGLGFWALSLRYFTNDFITVILANFLIVLGLVFCVRGLSKYKEFNYKFAYIDWISLTIFVLSFYYFTYISPNVNMRIITVASFQVIYFALMVYILNQRKIDVIKKESFYVSLYFMFALIVNVIRVIWTIFEANITNFMDAGIIHALSIIVFQGLPFNLSLGLFWLTNTRIEYQLKTQAMTDSLTQIYNRLAFMQIAEREISRSDRKKTCLGIAMGDIDHFKQVNDTYGHQVGDEVLRVVANLIRANIRSSDVLARYGGEEFIILFTDIEECNSGVILEKLRLVIEEYDFTSVAKDLKITMSFGVANKGKEVIGIDDLIKKADDSLYFAKKNGRNRVIVYGEN